MLAVVAPRPAMPVAWTASMETVEGAPAVSMAVDLLTIKVAEATAATVDVAATAAVVMVIEATERVSAGAVDVAATPNHGGVG